MLSADRRRLHFALVWRGRAERRLLHRAAACFSLVGMMPLIDIIIVGYSYVRFYWYVPHRRIASTTSATYQAHGGTLRRPRTAHRGSA